MKTSFVIGADLRDAQRQGCEPPPASQGQGSGHSLRRQEEPRALILDHQNLLTMIDNETLLLLHRPDQGRRADRRKPS